MYLALIPLYVPTGDEDVASLIGSLSSQGFQIHESNEEQHRISYLYQPCLPRQKSKRALRLSGSPVGVSSSSVARLAYRSIVTLFLTAFILFTGSLWSTTTVSYVASIWPSFDWVSWSLPWDVLGFAVASQLSTRLKLLGRLCYRWPLLDLSQTVSDMISDQIWAY